MVRLILISIFVLGITQQAHAWIYPEHRYIALYAIQKLNGENRAILDRMWADARRGHEGRLTDAVIDAAQGTKPKSLDYASWAAIAGDHSCSPQQMMDNVLNSDWILKVADIAARLDQDIKKANSKSKHINAIRDSDIRLQRADAEYATRAGSNNVHFLLARPHVDTDAPAYKMACLLAGAELNAVGAYSWFHLSAMKKATRYAQEGLTAEQKSAIILAALADEAFALHFLEDAFAAGHTAGTWGVASVRKGTHDYYNERGLEVVTWDGRRTIAKGDAFITPQDAEFAAAAVQLSLEQLIYAANGASSDLLNDNSTILNQPDTLDVCKNNFMPNRSFEHEGLEPILKKTPVPGLATGNGELPRFRSELGMFVGISTGLNLSGISGGFGKDQNGTGAIGGLDANVRVGLGLDGVINQAGDGLVFFQFGIRQDASSSNQFVANDASIPAGAVTAAIPARTAYNFRLRLPFWLIPGDLILAAPILAIVSPKSIAKMAVTAGNGGVIPWQSGIATPIGRFQFVLGREVGISIYGSATPREDALVMATPTTKVLVQYSSTKFDFPILEYRPFRTFSLNQSSMVLIQLTAGVDIPFSPLVLAPIGEPVPELKSVYHIGLRILFDWRQYL